MRLAPATAAAAIPSWSPGAVSPSTSTRAAGLIRGGFDAWRGVPERSVGVPLTPAMVDSLAPFLARSFGVDAKTATDDLRSVRVHVGGLAHDAGNVATTIGPNIYVSDAAHATRMLSWGGRRWLAHELGHTMQWRRAGATDRAFLDAYLGAYVADGGKLDAGGLVQAFREWHRRHKAGEPGKVGDIIHDTHPMEREAERAAVAFAKANP